MTTPGRPETVLDEQILDEIMSRATSRWGGSLRPCRWITMPSETTRQATAAGIGPPEAKEAEEAVCGAEAATEQAEAAPVTETSEGERPTDEHGDEPTAREAAKAAEATRAKAATPVRARRAKKAEAPRPARTRGTKKR